VLTKSLRVAREDLKLRRVFVVHPGAKSFPLEEWAEAVAIERLRSRLTELLRQQRKGSA
jgi:hypothetical protein